MLHDGYTLKVMTGNVNMYTCKGMARLRGVPGRRIILGSLARIDAQLI